MIDMARAQKLLDELKKNYIAELPTKFDDLELLVFKVKSGVNFNEDVGELFRKVHSLKGSAGTHGLHDISKVCHRFEDHLRAIDSHQIEFDLDDANKWIAHIDLMRHVLDAYKQDQHAVIDIDAELDAMTAQKPEHACLGLIVDQSRTNGMFYQSVLGSLPIKFTLMTDGYGALDLLLNDRFDLLVTSLELKKLNGLALIGAVKLANGVSKNIKTIMVTSNPKAVPEKSGVSPDQLIVKGSNLGNELLGATRTLLNLP